MARRKQLASPSKQELPTNSKISTLPAEILCYIISFMNPLSVVRLQRVSKWLHAIASDPNLWKLMYKTAPFARPPGPFPWQSTRLLQWTLIRSAYWEENWTSKPMTINPQSRRMVPHAVARAQWIDYRWAVYDERRKGTTLYDIVTNTKQCISNNGPLRSKTVSAWTVTAKGRFLYLLVNAENSDKVKLHEFQLDDESGQPSGPIFTVNLPCLNKDNVNAQASYIHCGGGGSETPFLYIFVSFDYDAPQDLIIFDTQRRIFYKPPEFKSQLVKPRQYLDASKGAVYEQVLPTITHIFVLYRGYPAVDNPTRLLQAFVAPESPAPDKNGICELNLTHETLTGDRFECGSLLSNAIVDSSTGSTTIRWLPKSMSRCTTITLPQQPPNAALPGPISIRTCKMLSTPPLDTNINPNIRPDLYISKSLDGVVRGIYATQAPQLLVSIYRERDPWPDTVLHNVTINASGTGEEPEVVLADERWLEPSRYGVFRRNNSLVWFDGGRGRVCYSTEILTGVNNTYVSDFE